MNIYTLSLLDFTEEPDVTIEKEVEKKEEKIKVDIKGEINAKGVYELDKGSRVIDLINKAGGTTKNADTSVINLSKKLKDEMVVFIYSKSEVNKLKQNNQIEYSCPEINDACTEETIEPLVENKTETKQTTQTNGKISINSATAEELQTLNGIGESKAEAIIKYRKENGKFKTIDELLNVKGIGESVFEKIKDNITT